MVLLVEYKQEMLASQLNPVGVRRRVCLLDFDGVVLQNHSKASRVIANKCSEFTHKYLQDTGSKKEIQDINRSIYGACGHTVLGLRALGYTTSAADFDKYVYDDIYYDKLFANIRRTHKQSIGALTRLKHRCAQDGVELMLYSNAPDRWCYNVLSYMDRDLAHNIGSVRCMTWPYLKPQNESYFALQVAFGAQTDVCFVDDNMINLVPTSGLKNWSAVWFTQDMCRVLRKGSYDSGLVDSILVYSRECQYVS